MKIPSITVRLSRHFLPRFRETHGIRFAVRLLPVLLGFWFLCACGESAPAPSAPSRPTLRLGSDRLLEQPYLGWVEGKSVGLVANHTAVNAKLEGVAGMLSNHPGSR